MRILTTPVFSILAFIAFSPILLLSKPPRPASSATAAGIVQVVDSANRWQATFTSGSYTVTLAGPQRRFGERTATYPVTHGVWVRVLPTPFSGTVDSVWLNAALAANQASVPDVLALSMEYIERAPDQFDATLRIAGDANYGPLQADGTRQEGSDFNDYLGVSWVYPNGIIDSPEEAQWDCLDCSGFMRMIWGARHSLNNSGYSDNVPLCITPLADRSAIPRRSFEIFDAAPGVVIIANAGVQVTNIGLLGIGDLVFFDASTNDGTQIDHVGMYLGVDAGNRHRFISSRKGINGPTMGDYSGSSVLDGTGLYARTFRAARRL